MTDEIMKRLWAAINTYSLTCGACDDKGKVTRCKMHTEQAAIISSLVTGLADDFTSLEDDAANVVREFERASERGGTLERMTDLRDAVTQLKRNGREGWWHRGRNDEG